MFHSAGHHVPNVVEDYTNTIDYADDFVLWDSEFLFDGYIHAIEYMASDVTGSFQIEVG